MANATGLQFTFSGDAASRADLNVVEFDVDEGLSTPYLASIKLASRNKSLTEEMFVDQTAHLNIFREGKIIRTFHGVISSFTKGNTGFHHTHYHVEMVPSLFRLSLRSNLRIFQNLTVLDIVRKIFSEMSIYHEESLRNLASYAQREYCVQYRETDLEFVERLLAEEGIFYYFEHSAEKHVLILADDSSVLNPINTPCPYNVMVGGYEKEKQFVRSFEVKSAIKPSFATLNDYTFKSPSARMMNQRVGRDMAYQGQEYEHYDYPGRYKINGVGNQFVQTRIAYLRRDARTGLVQSNIAQMISGHIFTLSEHQQTNMNRGWLTTFVHHKGTQPQSLEEDAVFSNEIDKEHSGAVTYNNEVGVIPDHLQWKPTPNPKPRVDGPHIAIVTGPASEEIFCDEFGRVKVQFPWDRDGKFDQDSSCWIRVSDSWAGPGYGVVALPRIGHEVIVSFLEGDPDQPIITGRTYHATNKQPYPLPVNKTKTVIKTRTHKGAGFNELSFEDDAGREEVYIHAQKDMNTLVLNDKKSDVNNECHLTVGTNYYTTVGQTSNHTIGTSRATTIGTEDSHTVGVSLNQSIGTQWLVQAGVEIHHAAGAKVVISAGAEITLTAGGSFLKIDPSGVRAVGPICGWNIGGVPGIGTPAVARPSLPPKQVSAFKTPSPFVPVLPPSAEFAARIGK